MGTWISIVALILGIIEGLTEFIPVSSTGHLIVAGSLLKFESLVGSADKAELFYVVIQLGAILAVGWLFRARLFSSLTASSMNSAPGRLRTNLFVAFLPAAILGFLFHKQIKMLLNPLTVAIMLIIGGIVIIMVELFTKEEKRTTTIDTMTVKDALIVGFSQVISMIPGTSRSAATIMGGMLGGMTRQSATEFSFLLSFPIMVAASLYEIYHYHHLLTKDMLSILAIGFVVAFIVSFFIVGWLVHFVQRHTFLGFGVYRLILGAVILFLYYGMGLLN
jgi:undecaprenyl-diphosphatase